MNVLESIQAIVSQLTSGQIYLAKHRCTIAAQHDDDTVDLTPESDDLKGKGYKNVTIRHGLPGVRVRVRVGSTCLLGFEGGKPSAPYVSLWDAGSVEKLMFGGGAQGIARVGDLVQVYWPVLNIVGGVLNGLPFAATIAIASPSIGQISTGSTTFFASD